VSAEVESILAPRVEAVHLERLAAFVTLLEAANATHNLTAARTPSELAEHIADALTLLPFVREPLVDVGSGGGFPALPLAIVTGMRATLIESVAKKARFLVMAAAELGLAVDVVVARAEVAAHDPAFRERFASATARAVGPLPTVLELTLPFLRAGGSAVLQRGALGEEERRAGADAALMLGAEISEEILLDGSRRLVIVRKLSATPARLPRRTGIPQKRPLCSRPPPGQTSSADG
jgi:16S rRNA (guanine527-N7)-methyltransferase